MHINNKSFTKYIQKRIKNIVRFFFHSQTEQSSSDFLFFLQHIIIDHKHLTFSGSVHQRFYIRLFVWFVHFLLTKISVNIKTGFIYLYSTVSDAYHYYTKSSVIADTHTVFTSHSSSILEVSNGMNWKSFFGTQIKCINEWNDNEQWNGFSSLSRRCKIQQC